MSHIGGADSDDDDDYVDYSSVAQPGVSQDMIDHVNRVCLQFPKELFARLTPENFTQYFPDYRPRAAAAAAARRGFDYSPHERRMETAFHQATSLLTEGSLVQLGQVVRQAVAELPPGFDRSKYTCPGSSSPDGVSWRGVLRDSVQSALTKLEKSASDALTSEEHNELKKKISYINRWRRYAVGALRTAPAAWQTRLKNPL